MSVVKTAPQNAPEELLDGTPEISEITPSFRYLLPEELQQISNDIKKVKFTPYLNRWIDDYERVGQRGRFLWQWCWKGVNMTTLPCVEPKLREHVMETKMLGIFYGTLIDDIA